MSGFATVDFFSDVSLIDDPNPYFEHLRKRGPAVALSQHPVVTVVGYSGCPRRTTKPSASCSA